MTTDDVLKHPALTQHPIPSCLDAAYERIAMIQWMNTNPVFPENIEWWKVNAS